MKTTTATPRTPTRAKKNQRPAGKNAIYAYIPGLTISFVVAVLAMLLSRVVPLASPALTTVVLGIIATNTRLVPETARPGLAVAAKQVLRIGIVLLGFQLALGDILALGPGVLGIIVAVVAGGVGVGLVVGRMLRLPQTESILISCGFSICGAAAVAAANGALDTFGDDEEKRERLEAQTAVAVALVVVFGTLMIGLVPVIATARGFGDFRSGVLAGGSIHEVAQVVAAGSIIGSGALAVAVLVKLGRVVLLAPMIALITAVRRESAPAAAGKRPSLMPLFIVGFLLAIAIRTAGILPMLVIDAIAPLQVIFLAAAMFALGTGAMLMMVKQVAAKPPVLASAVTLVVLGISLGGAYLIS